MFRVSTGTCQAPGEATFNGVLITRVLSSSAAQAIHTDKAFCFQSLLSYSSKTFDPVKILETANDNSVVVYFRGVNDRKKFMSAYI